MSSRGEVRDLERESKKEAEEGHEADEGGHGSALCRQAGGEGRGQVGSRDSVLGARQ